MASIAAADPFSATANAANQNQLTRQQQQQQIYPGICANQMGQFHQNKNDEWRLSSSFSSPLV